MPPLVFHLIAHTHWDREWYLPRAAFQARLVGVLDDLVARLEADPAYRTFVLDGQTVHLEDYLRVRPEMKTRVRALVGAGRLQVGPWYVLADEQIPSAEALVRNLLLGATDAGALGRRLDVLYSPDAFGHPAVWPTLAAEFGIRFGALWRGLGGERGGDLYRWRGPDGAAVTIYHLPPDGYEVGAALPTEPSRLAGAWPALRRALVARATTRHVAVLVGADHHAAHPALVELRDALAALEGVAAEVRISGLDEFLRDADAAVADLPDGLPTLEGELRWSYGYTWTLQGVHGTRAHLKRRNAAAELLLERAAEPLAALARWEGRGEHADLLAFTWRTLVRSQFHDTLGGCASDEVAHAAAQRLGDVEAAAGEVVRASLHALAGHDADAMRDGRSDGAALLLWNPAARARGGVVVADTTWFRRDVLVGPPGDRIPREGPGHAPFTLRAADGTRFAVQPLGRVPGIERRDAPRHYPDLDAVDVVRVAFRAPTVGGLGLARLGSEPGREGEALQGDVRVEGTALANELIEVTVAPDGTLTIVDRRTGERYADLLAPELEGDRGDTYTFCPAPRPGRDAPRPLAVRVLADGPLVGAFEIRGGLGAVRLRTIVQLHADSPLVRCTVELDNAEVDARLRLRLPTGITGSAALAGAQFGAVARAPVRVRPEDHPRETPVTTAPAHRFVAAADGGRGLALLAPGFFEYEWDADGDMRFTVFRAVGELSKANLDTRPGHAGWATATPLAQSQGPDRLQLALLPTAGPLAPDRLLEAWEDAFLPLRAEWLRDAAFVHDPAPLGVELEGQGLVFSACKPALNDDAVVLRCYNASDRPARGAWRFARAVRGAERARADETTLELLSLDDDGRRVAFEAGPRALVTVRVRP